MINSKIDAHDRLVSFPRHQENLDRFEQIENSVKEMMQQISEWKWPIKAIIVMEGMILTGVIVLVGDLLMWGMKNHWNYFGK